MKSNKGSGRSSSTQRNNDNCDASRDDAKTLPVLPVRDVVIFKGMITTLYLIRDKSIKAVSKALEEKREVFVTAQYVSSVEDPKAKDLYPIGTTAYILRLRNLPNGRMKVLVQGQKVATAQSITTANFTESSLESSFLQATVKDHFVQPLENYTTEVERKLQRIKENFNILAEAKKIFNPEILKVINDSHELSYFLDLLANNLGLKLESAQKLLSEPSVEGKLFFLDEILCTEVEILKATENKIQPGVSTVKNGGGIFPGGDESFTEDLEILHKDISASQMPELVEKEALKQWRRLKSMHPETNEASMLRNYLDTLVELPWNEFSSEKLDIACATETLEADHHGLEKVKEKILEFLAVKKLKGSNLNNNILCLVGPPGVGKTSLGKSIAKALNRKYYRIALGGVQDESEVRGHRRTYVAAMPGKIIQAFQQVKTKNPVIVLDEVDKMGSNFKGDPCAAMLEVLDSEQNTHFKDHYLNVEFDLSHTFFIATANMVEDIPTPLRDRMDMIQLSGYAQQDKLVIAKKHIVSRQLANTGLIDKNVVFTNEGLNALIINYTKEAGVRELSRQVLSVCKKIARQVVDDPSTQKEFVVDKTFVYKALGSPRYLKEESLKNNQIGVVTGLAWTPVGGEILYVEALKIVGKGGFKLTGQLGDVMKESAQAALSYAKAHRKVLNIKDTWFDENSIHIHLPSGAIPKDGPSAGVTLATALVSLITEVTVKKNIAMTGEISLTGRVLPVGGIKEKMLAALSHGINKVILPFANKKDVEEIPKKLRETMNFIFVEHLDEVLSVALDIAYKDKKSTEDLQPKDSKELVA